MSNVYSLTQLNQALDSKYGPLQFDTGNGVLELRSILRLNSVEREAVVNRLQALDGREADNVQESEMIDTLRFVLSTVVAEGKGHVLLELFGDDILALQELFTVWMESTQAGEPAASSV